MKYSSVVAVVVMLFALSFPFMSTTLVVEWPGYSVVKNIPQPFVAQASSWWKIVSTKWDRTITRLWQLIQPVDMQVWDSIILPANATLSFVTSAWAKWAISWPAKIILIENSQQKNTIDIRYAQNFSIISLVDKSLNIKTPTWVLTLSKNSKKLDLQLVVTPTRHIVRNKGDSITIASKNNNTVVKTQMIATVSDKFIALKQIKIVEAELLAWKTTATFDTSKEWGKNDLQRAEVLTFFDKQVEQNNNAVAFVQRPWTWWTWWDDLVIAKLNTNLLISENQQPTTLIQEDAIETKKVLDRAIFQTIEEFSLSWCDTAKRSIIKSWLWISWDPIDPSQIIKALEWYYVPQELIIKLNKLICSPKI